LEGEKQIFITICPRNYLTILLQTDFTPTGKLRDWVHADRRVPEAVFMDSEAKATLLRRWKEDGFSGKLGWYKVMTENVNWEHEQKLVPKGFKLSIPVLFIGGSRDAPCPAPLGELITKQLCEDYTGIVIDSSHWMPREKPAEWLEIVKPWLVAKF
jgi:soluble epoxide hydrolase/lipid-phosphate phosphatase